MLGVVTTQQLAAPDVHSRAPISAAALPGEAPNVERPNGRSADSSTHSAVQRSALAIALLNAARSVPLLLVAVFFIAWLGFDAGRNRARAATAIVGVAVAIWRLLIARRYAGIEELDDQRLRSARPLLYADSLTAADRARLTGRGFTIVDARGPAGPARPNPRGPGSNAARFGFSPATSRRRRHLAGLSFARLETDGRTLVRRVAVTRWRYRAIEAGRDDRTGY